MNQCPHCNAEIEIRGTLALKCPECGKPLSDVGSGTSPEARSTLPASPPDDPHEQPTRQPVAPSTPDPGNAPKPSSSDSGTAETIDVDAIQILPEVTRPRVPSPQHERNVRKRLAATYDMDQLSGGSLETIKAEKSAIDTAAEKPKKKWTGGGIEENAVVGFESSYQLEKQIGRGGMGRVWKARQRSLRREVALKIPFPPDERLDEGSKRQKRERIERQFISEVLVTAKLDHPNIVPVYEMGTDSDGNPILAMKLLSGNSWDHSIKTNSEEENLEILLKACDAIAFAHAQKVVHLDLKPENIWVGDYGEVSVVDWGVAVRFQPTGEPPSRPDDNDWNVEMDGLPGLTPAYAAPEMIDSVSQGQIGPATDVYLLGAVLYEILTGSPPHAFSGNPMSDAMKAWRNEIVPTDKTGELISIAHAAMATEPHHRHESVKEFQAAIRDFQSHRESVMLSEEAQASLGQASEYGHYQTAIAGFDNAIRLWDGNAIARKGSRDARLAYAEAAKERQDYDLGLSVLEAEPEDSPLVTELVRLKHARDNQNRTLARARWTVRGLVAASVIGLLFFSAWIWQEKQVQEGLTIIAEEKTLEAQKNLGVAKQKTIEAELNAKLAVEAEERAVIAADEAMRNADIAQENEMAAIEARGEAEQNARLAENRATQNKALAERNREIADEARRNELKAIAATRRALQVSYRSKLGLAGETIQRNGFDAAKRILDELEQERVQSKLRHWEWGNLYSTSYEDAVSDFRTDKKERLPRVESVAMSPDTKVVVAGAEDGSLFVWIREKQKYVVRKHGPAIHAVAVSPDGRWIASGGIDEKQGFDIRIWSTEGKALRRLPGHKAPVLSLAFSADSSEILSAAADDTARLWSFTDPERSGILRDHHDNVRSARYSPDGRWIVTASDDRFVRVYSSKDRTLAQRFVGHTGPVYDATFTSDGQAIVSGGEDRRVLLWRNLPTMDAANRFIERQVASVERAITSGGSSEVPVTREFEIVGRHDGVVTCVCSANGLIFSASHDNTTRVWAPDEDEPLQKTLRGHGQWIRSCIPDSRGNQVLTGSYDGRVRLWNWKQHHLPHVLAAAGQVAAPVDSDLQTLAQSPDGRWIATGSAGGQLTMWEVNGNQVKSSRLKQGHDWLATRGHFFDDGNRLLTTGGDNKAIIWDAARGTQLLKIGSNDTSDGGIGWYGVASVSSDGRLVVTGGDQKAVPVKLWNARTGGPMWSPEITTRIAGYLQGAKAITVAAFSPRASTSILIGDDLGRVFVIHTSDGSLQHRLTEHTKPVKFASFSRDGSTAFTGSSDGTVRTWSLETGKQTGVKIHPGSVTALQLSPGGELMITASRLGPERNRDEDDALVHVWHTNEDERPLYRLRLGDIVRKHFNRQLRGDAEATVRSAEFHHDGSRALVTTFVRSGGTGRYLVGNWQWEHDYQPFDQFRDISSAVYAPTESERQQDDQVLVVGGKGARILTKHAGIVVRKYEQLPSIRSISFSRDSRRLAVGGGDGSLTLWQLSANGWAPVSNNQPNAHRGGVHAVVFHPLVDGLLCSAGADGKLKAWRIDARSNLKAVDEQVAHEGAVHGLVSDLLQGRLLSFGVDGRAKFWEIRNDKFQSLGEPLTLETDAPCGALSADGKWAAFGNGFEVSLWHVDDRQRKGKLMGHLAAVESVTFSYDGMRVATSGADSTVRIWDTSGLLEAGDDVPDFQELLPLEEHRGPVNAAQFSPTGQHLVSAGSDGQTILWPAVPVLPSITVLSPNLQLNRGQQAEAVPVSSNLQLVAPTLADFSSARLTVELRPVEDLDGLSPREALALTLPDGFEFASREPNRLVVVRRAGHQAAATIQECLVEQRQWQRMMQAIRYRIPPAGNAERDSIIERTVTIQLEGPRLFGDGTVLGLTEDEVHLRLHSSASSNL